MGCLSREVFWPNLTQIKNGWPFKTGFIAKPYLGSKWVTFKDSFYSQTIFKTQWLSSQDRLYCQTIPRLKMSGISRQVLQTNNTHTLNNYGLFLCQLLTTFIQYFMFFYYLCKVPQGNFLDRTLCKFWYYYIIITIIHHRQINLTV